jgi:hypothetical protein
LLCSDGDFQDKEENVTGQRVLLDTPNIKDLLALLRDAWENADKPRALSRITHIEPSFSESWGGIDIVNKDTEGEHFWLGIWWDEPSRLQFAFAPALYDRGQVEGVEGPEQLDWWPYVPFELLNEFFGKSRRSQLDDIREFVEITLKKLATAKQY